MVLGSIRRLWPALVAPFTLALVRSDWLMVLESVQVQTADCRVQRSSLCHRNLLMWSVRAKVQCQEIQAFLFTTSLLTRLTPTTVTPHTQTLTLNNFSGRWKTFHFIFSFVFNTSVICSQTTTRCCCCSCFCCCCTKATSDCSSGRR